MIFKIIFLITIFVFITSPLSVRAEITSSSETVETLSADDSILVIFSSGAGGSGSSEWIDISNKNLGAGKGLNFAGDSFSVNVNPSNLEIVNDTIKIKVGGITGSEILDGSITGNDITIVPPNTPTVTSITPDTITVGYATSLNVTITGTNFESYAQAKVGVLNLLNESIISSSSISATVPVGLTTGTYNVKVNNFWESGTGSNLFTVKPPSPWIGAENGPVTETRCDYLTGWRWYTTNGRSACWSKTLIDAVSMNKMPGDNNAKIAGKYTCATGYTLNQRMNAAISGEWHKIVSNVNDVSITSGDNGQTGATKITALSISDCIDGVRDLCGADGSECLGTDWSTINSSLRTWAIASGKSALPYLSTDAGTTQATNDYWDACAQNSSNDLPLNCTDGLFYKNRKSCSDGDDNYSWVAGCADGSGSGWAHAGRSLGSVSCSNQAYGHWTQSTDNYLSFRVVVRP